MKLTAVSIGVMRRRNKKLKLEIRNISTDEKMTFNFVDLGDVMAEIHYQLERAFLEDEKIKLSRGIREKS